MSVQAILDAVSFAASRFLRSPDWTNEIDEVIRRLGQAAGVSRVRIFECHPSEDGVSLISQRYEWTAPGVTPQLDNPACLDVPWEAATFRRCAEHLKQGNVLSGPIDDFTEEERLHIAAQDILSLAMVPILFEQDLWGILGFDDCVEKREWTPVEIGALRTAADIIGQSIHRREAEVSLARSEQRFRGLVEQSLVAIGVESAGEIVFVNQAFAQMLGADRPDEIVGQPVTRFVHDDSLTTVQEGIEKVQSGASTHLDDVKLLRLDGTRVRVELSASPTTYDGRSSIQTVFVDVTKRKRAEEARAASEEQFRMLFENARDAIFWADAETGVLINCNRAAEELLERPRAEIIGQHQTTLHPPGETEVYAGRFKEHVESHGAVDNELDVITKSGIRKPVRVSAAVTTIAGKPVIQGIFRDISERKRAEVALRESEERLRSLFATMAEGVVLIAPDGRIAQANPAAAHILGLEPRDIEGLDFVSPDWKIVRPDGRPMPPEEMPGPRAMKEQRPVKNVLMGVERPDGAISWINVSAAPLIDDAGELTGVVGSFSDVTERRKAVEALRESEERLSLATRATNDAIWDCDLVAGTVWWNESYDKLFGARPRETGSSWQWWIDHIHPEDRDRTVDSLYAAIEGEDELWTAEYRYRKRDDSYAYVVDRAHIARDAAGKAYRILGAMADLTDRKRAEEALRESEERYRALMHNIPVGIYRNTPGPKGQFLLANPAIARMFGCETVEEFLQCSVAELYADPSERRALSDKLLDRGELMGEELRLKRKDGTPIWGAVTARVRRDASGEIAWFDGMIEDITERKRAEEALREGEERYRMLVESTSAISWEFDPATRRFTFVAPQALGVLGYHVEDWYEQDFWTDHLHPDDRAEAIQYCDECTQRGEDHEFEYRMMARDGRAVWIQDMVTVVSGEDGVPSLLRGIMVDITERRRAEEARKESEEKYRLLLQHIPGMVYRGVPDWSAEVVSDSEPICGYGTEEFNSRRLNWLDIIHPDDRDRVFAESSPLVKEKASLVQEYRIIAKDGGVRWLSDHKTSFFSEDGTFLGTDGIAFDITQQKAAQEAVHRQAAALEQSISGIAVSDMEGDLKSVNRAFAEMHGYRPEELLGKHLSVFHTEEQMERDVNPFNDIFRERGQHSGEVEHVTRDGTTFPTWMSCALLRDAEGAPIGMIGTALDITERKRAECALRESEASARALLNATTDIALLTERDGTIIALNETTARIFGRTADELIGMPVFDHMSPEIAARRHARVEEVVRTRAPLRYEERRDDRCFDTCVYPILDSEGDVHRLAIFAHDITERLRADEALRESERRSRDLANLLPQTVFEMDIEGTFTFTNQSGLETFGYTEQDMAQGVNVAHVIVPGDRERAAQNITKIISGETLGPNEYTALRKDGTTFPAIVLSAVITRDGKPAGLRGFLIDITARKEAEEALRESEEKYRQLFTAETDAIMVFDAETRRFVDVNHAAVQLYGYSREEFLQLTQEDITAEPEKSDVSIRRMLREGIARIPLRYHRKKDGTVFPAEISGGVFAVKGRRVIYGAIRDISERLQAEQALHESEERYRMLVDMSPDAIGVVADGKIAFMNPAGAALLAGDRNADVVGRRVLDFIHPDDRHVVADRMRLALAGRDADYPVEEKVVRPDGTELDIEISAVPFHVGDELRAQVMFRDITERKRARLALRRYARRLGALHELDGAILAKAPVHEIAASALAHIRQTVPCVRAGLVEFAESTGYATILAARPEGPAGFQRGARVPLEHFGDIGKLKEGEVRFIRDIAHEAPASYVFAHLLKEGVNASINVPLIAGGELIGALNVGAQSPDAFEGESTAVIREIADTVAVAIRNARLDEQVRRHGAELEERVKERTAELEAFSYSVSHDLQTPIRAIDGFSDMVLRDYADRLDAEGIQRLEIIRDSSKGMKQLIDDLLRFHRLAAQKMQHARIDMTALVQEVIKALRQADAASDVTFQIDPLDPATGDIAMIRQALQNLLSNAVKFSAGRKGARVRIDCRRDHHQNVYCVTDNGVGFDMKHADKLFRVFERLHSSSEFPGTGAGLAIVKRIVERHGGRVWAQGEVNRGASLYFSVPRADTSNDALADP